MEIIRLKTEAALAKVIGNYYGFMPEFPQNSEPKEYACYNIHTKPVNWSSGIYNAKSSWVDVSVITLKRDDALYEKIIESFEAEGFILSEETDVSAFESSSPFPHRYQYSLNFLIDIDIERK